MPLRAFACFAAVALSAHAHAFTFSDGSTMQCFVGGKPIEEQIATPADPVIKQGRIALTEPAGGTYRIVWNDAQLKALPPEMHDFIFFHECAHASVPTKSEVTANCVGLQAMRTAGRAGFKIESRLAAFYGPASGYWQQTLACANAFKPVGNPSRPGGAAH